MQFRYFLKNTGSRKQVPNWTRSRTITYSNWTLKTELGFDFDIEMFSLAKQSNIKNGNCFFLNIAFKFYV